MRRAARTDDNHTATMCLFRRLGCSVLDLSAVGQGCPDLLVGCAGHMRLVEVKDGTKSPSRRRLTAAQQLFRELWRGHPVRVVETEGDAEALAAEMRRVPEPRRTAQNRRSGVTL